MNDAMKTAELKAKLKNISNEEKTNQLSNEIADSVIAFMAGAVRSLAFGSVFYGAQLAIIQRIGALPLNWIEAVCVYATYEILLSTIKKLKS